jgi:hypothetical protein
MRAWPFVLVALAGGAVAFEGWQEKHHRAEIAAMERRIAAIDGAMSATGQRVSALSLAEARTAIIAQAGALSAAPTDPPKPAESAPATPKMTSQEVEAHVASAHAAEAVDRAWAPEAQRTLLAGLREDLPARSSLHRVDCRTSVCRIEVSHPGRAEDMQFVEHVQKGDAIWSGAGMVTRTFGEDGSIEAVIYLAREGHGLPFPSEPPAPPPG